MHGGVEMMCVGSAMVISWWGGVQEIRRVGWEELGLQARNFMIC